MKKLLYMILPERAYLFTLHRFFYLLYRLGLLKHKEAFKFHYFVKRIIKPDFVVIDIGANLGYFAKNFARLAHQGKVIAIEPLPQFHAVLGWGGDAHRVSAWLRRIPWLRSHAPLHGREVF